MKVLLIKGSPHRNGSSNILADRFMAGAKESGHEVITFDVAHAEIAPCLACEYCHTKSKRECYQNLHFVVYVNDEKIGIALKELPEKQRAFILLYYFRGMSDREIAALYHISRSAVGYTRNRGLQRLEEVMKERS